MPGKSAVGATVWNDPDDAPELDDAFFDLAEISLGETVVRRGRPAPAVPKQPVTIRISKDVVDAFRADGRGWQTRMELALRDWLAGHGRADPTGKA